MRRDVFCTRICASFLTYVRNVVLNKTEIELSTVNMSWEMLRAELRKENVQQGFELWDELFEDKKRISQQVLEELRSLATPSFNSYINTVRTKLNVVSFSPITPTLCVDPRRRDSVGLV